MSGQASNGSSTYNIITDEEPEHTLVFGADHVYRMDVRQMLAYHTDNEADLTVAAIPVPRAEAADFGIIEMAADGRMIGFVEKPKDPPRPMPGDPTRCLASMGNYLFNFEVLREILIADHFDPQSRHDIGGDLFPRRYDKLHIHAYNFLGNRISGGSPQEEGYWRDVGNISSYWRTSMDMVSVSPVLARRPSWCARTTRSRSAASPRTRAPGGT